MDPTLLRPATPIRPGYRTTEFWMSVVATMLGVITASGLIPATSPLSQPVGLAVAILASMGYTAARVSIKKAASVLLLGALFAGTAGMTACQATPITIAGQATVTLTMAEQTETSLITNHQLSRDAALVIQPYLEAARAAEQAYAKNAVVPGATSGNLTTLASSATAALNAYIGQLDAAVPGTAAALQAKAKAGK